MIWTSKYFKIQEFVPPEIYHQYGEGSIKFINPDIVTLADFTREFFGRPMTINNWHLNGPFSNRGFRVPDCKTGGRLSQHKFKDAFDHHQPGVDMREVYRLIMENEKIFMEVGLTTMENIDFTDPIGNPKTGWIHMDNRWTGSDHIVIVNPS